MPFSLRDKGTLGVEQKGWDEGMFVSNFVSLNSQYHTATPNRLAWNFSSNA